VSKLIRDDNHFRYFAPDPPAVIPEGVSMQLEFKTATELVAERKAWIAETETCRCCGGLGRTPLAKSTLPPS
jgi:hypothetical protein